MNQSLIHKNNLRPIFCDNVDNSLLYVEDKDKDKDNYLCYDKKYLHMLF